jgi:hypothetical protein|tara:strand:+ start:15204 stop:15365 length:162 start_codon:yes stop_codon:yes gene_type:complete
MNQLSLQLKKHRPKIKVTIEEDFKGDWQLHPDFVVPDDFDENKPARYARSKKN